MNSLRRCIVTGLAGLTALWLTACAGLPYASRARAHSFREEGVSSG